VSAVAIPLARVVALTRTSLARGVAWLVVVGLGTGFFLQMYARMARPTGNDLGARLASARILVAGGDPYTLTLPQGHGPYPLTIDALVIPLTWLPLGLAQTLWFALSVASLVGSLFILDALWRQARGGGGDPALAVPFEVRLAALALALFIPFQNHLRYGQVNLLLLCLTSLFLAFHLRRRGLAAAAALGGAVALKLTPGVFLLYLGRGRWYRTALGVAVWTLVWAVGLPALISSRVLELYRDGWVPEVVGLTSGPVEYEWRTRFTLAAVLTEIWPRLGTVPGLRQVAAAVVLAPLLWIQPRLARDPRGGLFLFALYTTAMPLISPVSETHHLAVLAGPLWIWLLAAGSPPHMPALDGIGGVLVLSGHWLGVALAGPAAGRQGSLFDGVTLLLLYGVLFVRSLRATAVPGARPASGVLADAPLDGPTGVRRRSHP
jgi:alpha-1,2-mannosyltransferase